MNDKELTCAHGECAKKFTPQRHNQKYCTSECCKNATNQRIRSKYSETKQRMRGKKRICINKKCETILSRYTEEDVCNKCVSTEKATQQLILKNKFRGV